MWMYEGSRASQQDGILQLVDGPVLLRLASLNPICVVRGVDLNVRVLLCLCQRPVCGAWL